MKEYTLIDLMQKGNIHILESMIPKYKKTPLGLMILYIISLPFTILYNFFSNKKKIKKKVNGG